jgi:hypothetical protein
MFEAFGEAVPPEELRNWLLRTAVAGMNVLAALAAQSDETEDLRASFLSVAAVWADDDVSAAPRLRLLRQMGAS